MRRSMLFLPGNTPNIIQNAEILGSDAVILDLEDAVAPTEKDSARILVRNAIQYMGFGKCEVIVRINATDTSFWQKDLDAIIPVRPSLIMPPKTACADDVRRVDEYITALEEKLGMETGSVGLIPLIETALGVENAFLIASASPRVKAIFLGGEDLTADLHCKRTKEGHEISYARSRMVMAARAAGVEVYDTPFTDVNDDQGIYTDAQLAKSAPQKVYLLIPTRKDMEIVKELCAYDSGDVPVYMRIADEGIALLLSREHWCNGSMNVLEEFRAQFGSANVVVK